MAFDVDRENQSLFSAGRKGAMIDYSGGNVTLGTSVKAVALCSAGNVVYRARGEASNAITMTGLPAGYILPHIPGVIVQSGSTATLCTIGD